MAKSLKNKLSNMLEGWQKARFQRKLEKMLLELTERNGIEIYGNLSIELANLDTLALLKGNKIYVDLKAMKLPDYVLKYIIAHELAHLILKRHTKRFWDIVKQIYPEYEIGRQKLLQLKEKLKDEF